MRKRLLALMLLAVASPGLVMAGEHRGHECCPPGPDGPGGAHQPGPSPDFASGPGLQGIELSQDQRKVVHDAGREEHRAVGEITRAYLDKLSDSDKASLKKALSDTRLASQDTIRKALSPDQVLQYDANLKREDDRRTEWEEFQKWKAAKRG